ncbi:MAG TPA: YbdK family carboxylate-amine ligase [Solirubrobacteraceae bacterium]|nr:YbdK family carboxylate-amine ligase [Solirubrobacteraceae bacterium]
MEHAFGRGGPFALGVEEELLLVNPATHELAHIASQLLPRATPPSGELKFDVYEALLETATPVVGNALEGARHLDGLRAALRAAGATLMGCGIHPAGAFADVRHVAEPRYRAIVDSMRGLITRTPTCAVHVHVAMPDAGTAVLALNRMREHLPLLQALAAHSPWWYGHDSGFATARAQMYRAYPRAIVPRAFAGWDEYAEVVAAAVAAADVADYTFLWWDLRLHPRLGTLELRAMDGQARLASVCGLSALVHALAVRAAHEGDDARTPWEALSESSFRAGRDGLDATVYTAGARRPVRELAAEALAAARPYARDVGAEAALEEVERILREGNGADRMRAAHARGGMPAVLSHLVAETAAGP